MDGYHLVFRFVLYVVMSSLFQSSIEAAAGVSGYRETQEALENVSTLKSDLDQMKGRTLEDISHMVQQLTRKIAEKKSSLAPVIKELRPMRQRSQVTSCFFWRLKWIYHNAIMHSIYAFSAMKGYSVNGDIVCDIH